MVLKRHSNEDILKLLREVELVLAPGKDVATGRCHVVGIAQIPSSDRCHQVVAVTSRHSRNAWLRNSFMVRRETR